MKNFFTFLLFSFFFTSFVFSQDNPVTLESEVKHIGGDKYELIIKAEIDPDWCMYSQELPEGGPYPTTISFQKNKNYEFLGKAKEDSPHKKIENDEIFNIELTKYYNTVLFKQVIKIKNKSKVKSIEADVDYMSCNMQTCMPPMQETLEFELEE